MEYEWDPVKAAGNLAKHGVAFEQTQGFGWEEATTTEDARRNYGESRFIAVGPIEGRLHVLVYTRRGDRIRVIGLRRANDRERVKHERAKEA
ncbi:MAG: BrnT family toxin [Bauldia sp.]|nr:BrnT family toxin [Bauldia sp.]